MLPYFSRDDRLPPLCDCTSHFANQLNYLFIKRVIHLDMAVNDLIYGAVNLLATLVSIHKQRRNESDSGVQDFGYKMWAFGCSK